MKVPLLDLKQQLSYLRKDMLEAVTRVIDSMICIQGPEVSGFEKEVAAYCGVANGVGVSSGTDALLVSLMALGIGPGDQVLTTPYSFFATMGVVLRLGATPVFADIDPVSFNINPKAMEEALACDYDRKIKAILPVHLYGQCADMSAIMKLAGQYNLPVIEDAAQAIGAEYPMDDGVNVTWRKAGAMGLAGCFSFFPSKNLGGIGDGGMVVSDNTDFADKIRILLNHGASPKYYHGQVGGNFRLDPIQAAVLSVKLKFLEQWHQARRENADRYNKLFVEAGLVQNNFLVLPQAMYLAKKEASQQLKGSLNNAGENFHIYNQYVLRVKSRDALVTWLRSQDIGCEIYYPLALHQQKCLGPDFPVLSFPEAERAAAETIALPIFPELSADMQAYVVEKIAEFYRQ
ncbi:MAG: pleiotropic regulatory [Desulfobulbaceae bacterium]|jgi:dTDP-4-amino-4,6-dideoxygalactose transaminase|nr:MAG: pleiotropic regulatory [Desulfobulbaceae bacterium]